MADTSNKAPAIYVLEKSYPFATTIVSSIIFIAMQLTNTNLQNIWIDVMFQQEIIYYMFIIMQVDFTAIWKNDTW